MAQHDDQALHLRGLDQHEAEADGGEERDERRRAGERRDRVMNSGTTMHSAVSSSTVNSSMPSTKTASMLCDDLPCFSRSKRSTSRSRSMLKKNGESSVGGAMLIGCAANGVEIAGRREAGQRGIGRGRRVERDLEAEAIGLRLQRRESPASSGDGLTSSVPMPSGALSPPSPRMLRTIAMCARGSATPRRCSAAVASAVMR